MVKKYAAGLAFALGVLFWSGAVGAAVCSADISLDVIGDLSGSNSGCQVGTTNNDEGQVNLDNMFTYNDWIFAGRDNGLDGQEGTTSIPINLVLTGGTLAGTWSINSTIFSLYEMVMLVFKDGNGIPPNYVGYLFDIFDGTTGTYSSPFANSVNGNPKEISHVSVYVRGVGACPSGNCSPPVGEVPLPAGILLLISALGGLGFLARFRKAGAAA